MVDNLELVARLTARATGNTREITVGTTDPGRGFVVGLTEEGATVQASNAQAASCDLVLPAEAFARLVYGRLDPAHQPPLDRSDVLDDLRAVFPGPHEQRHRESAPSLAPSWWSRRTGWCS